MIAYYIHWIYDVTCDDANFYGQDDDKLYHHKENAEKYAEDKINEWNNSNRFYYLYSKNEDSGLTPEEQEEYDKLANLVYGDLPYDYSIRERDIKFEDEL